MRAYEAYLENAKAVLDNILKTQSENIGAAIGLMYSAFSDGKSIFVFGASHAGMFTEEMYARAGGLMVANPIFNPALMLDTKPFTVTSDMERLPGFGRVIFKNSPVKRGDVLILHSVSGRNDAVIDMALAAREAGAGIIAVTSLDYAKHVKSRHGSGKMLFELADIAIDNCGRYGDGSIEVWDGVFAGPTSTVAGAAIANMLVVGFAEKCARDGIEPPVFESANADGGQERLFRLVTKYKDRIHYL